MKHNDPVYEILAKMLAESPEASYKRLNPALRSTLSSCIEADLPFKPDTFSRIYEHLRGGWWFGDGAGSHIGERFYTLAVELNHATAYQSFEKFAGRPACLWEEIAKTPERLHVGSRFTWKGHSATVTSMRKDSLVACTYKDYRDSVSGLKVGAEISYDNPHVITKVRKAGKETILHVIKAKKTEGDRDVAKRFVITYEEIVQFRRTEKERVKAVLTKIAACDPEKDRDTLTKEINAQHFRHFELEVIQAAFSKRKEWKVNEERIEAWRKGAGGAWLDVKQTLVRLHADSVECSNGNRVSTAAVKRVLPVVMARRNELGALSLPLDSYHVDRLSKEGVVIGCTLVPWPEVERLNTQITQG